ncbi:YeeE/YedE family protein [Massilia sp. BSC265]|uniref:YeeE/YedE family protein n=1 Tax=Massilia sp. BSC265 TaxID=1549812 RepID=UPI0004E8C8ED|nr:YeeE/YedE family protein [Massilia sp. BSC265]KFI06717.1 transporter [Massilia sp. BSC265]
MTILYALLAGFVFGIGLLLSGLANPAKVLAFLDLAGDWDPSLLFVMGGALLVAAPAFAWIARRGRTLDGAPLHLPPKGRIDRRLVLGSLVFGAGWGLAGYCPGPAFVSLAWGGLEPLLFVGAMVAGMAVFELLEKRR